DESPSRSTGDLDPGSRLTRGRRGVSGEAHFACGSIAAGGARLERERGQSRTASTAPAGGDAAGDEVAVPGRGIALRLVRSGARVQRGGRDRSPLRAVRVLAVRTRRRFGR